MATGTGKTIIFAELPAKLHDLLPGQTLILAHREELIDQAIDKMRKYNPTLRIDKEMADHVADPSLADCIVASVPTLCRPRRQRLYNWDRVDKTIIDEAHHSIADSYTGLLDAMGYLSPQPMRRLLAGFTATPQRGDGKALAQLYQKVVYSYGLRQAVEDGWLVEPRGIRVSTRTSLDKVKVVAGDYAAKRLAEAVNTPERNQRIVKAWLDNANGCQTVGFTVDIPHAKDLAAMFRQYGIKAEAVWGDDPDRAIKISTHRDAGYPVLLNCGVLTEGYDDWRIACVILACPTKSSVKYNQMIGRGTRLEEGTGNLIEYNKVFDIPIKNSCLILDVVDVSSRHSLITLPTLMGLPSGLDLKGAGVCAAAHQIEDAQKAYPHIDFTQLADISTLDAYIQNINLFDVKFTPEVEANSEFTWHPAATGGYMISLPKSNHASPRESLRIQQNLLDKYEIFGTIKGQAYRGERDTVEAAFQAADTLLQNTCADVLKVLRREESWHHEPATAPQLKLLMKLFKGKPLPHQLDKGKASRLISSHLAGQV